MRVRAQATCTAHVGDHVARRYTDAVLGYRVLRVQGTTGTGYSARRGGHSSLLHKEHSRYSGAPASRTDILAPGSVWRRCEMTQPPLPINNPALLFDTSIRNVTSGAPARQPHATYNVQLQHTAKTVPAGSPNPTATIPTFVQHAVTRTGVKSAPSRAPPTLPPLGSAYIGGTTVIRCIGCGQH
jgi:hypothetical protein